jgi:hypothetical protein
MSAPYVFAYGTRFGMRQDERRMDWSAGIYNGGE